jgi:hypothetical protein
MKVLILSGPNHGFERSAPVIHQFLNATDDLDVILEDQKAILTSGLDAFDVCVFGTGFTHPVRQNGGPVKWESELNPAQEDALFDFVRGGKGLVGIHGTGWNIGERAVGLLGGHANWHPPGLTFTVNIAVGDHPITEGLDDFEVEDEIYMSAWFPEIEIIATAQWADKPQPMAWTKSYGDGRVFYTALGHGPDTFTRPGMQQLMAQGIRWAGGN